jgi:hypothetical protein
MEKRIEINGVWYVPEEPHYISILNYKEIIEAESTRYEGLIWEDDKICLDGTVIITPIGKEMLHIKFNNKASKKEEYWDNESWILGVYNLDAESILELKMDTFWDDQHYIDILTHFIGKMIDLGFTSNT